MNMKEYAFGIDLGGTTAKVGLFTTAGALLESGSAHRHPPMQGNTSLETGQA